MFMALKYMLIDYFIDLYLLVIAFALLDILQNNFDIIIASGFYEIIYCLNDIPVNK